MEGRKEGNREGRKKMGREKIKAFGAETLRQNDNNLDKSDVTKKRFWVRGRRAGV